MYRCLDCGTTFEEPKRAINRHWEVDTRQDGLVLVCPSCYGDDIEKLKLCACGWSYIISDKDWCQDCLDKVSRMARLLGLNHEQTKDLLEYWISEN